MKKIKQSMKLQETIARHSKSPISDSLILDGIAEAMEVETTEEVLREVQALMLLREFVEDMDEELDQLTWIASKMYRLRKVGR